jgi:phenylpyruvate tautomerase PptA (4-oxalocrotonate tautomerase family)
MPVIRVEMFKRTQEQKRNLAQKLLLILAVAIKMQLKY